MQPSHLRSLLHRANTPFIVSVNLLLRPVVTREREMRRQNRQKERQEPSIAVTELREVGNLPIARIRRWRVDHHDIAKWRECQLGEDVRLARSKRETGTHSTRA